MSYDENPEPRVVQNHHLADFQPPAAVRYVIRFPESDQYYVDVEARFPVAPHAREITVFLPVWTPGSYLVREYSRHVEGLAAYASDGSLSGLKKDRKNRWTISFDEPADEVIVRYRIYCRDLTVRTNYRDDHMAVLNGAATFITATDFLGRQHEVKVEVPNAWLGCWSALPASQSAFVASNYDQLVDSPILAGSPSSNSFEIDGKPHAFHTFGDVRYWDLAKATNDFASVVRQHREMWGELPYERYTFFNLLSEGRGALEHRDSMLLLAGRFTMRSRDSYRGWLEVVSHEFFHVWNVKRLRPVELGPFDYENEVYTRDLWMAEGFTEYYGPLAVCRAGLTTAEEFLGTNAAPRSAATPDSLSGWVEDLQNTPGRLQQSASEASFDAWIKLYRPDENSRNSSISYYTKGAVIAWLLDAKVRAATAGVKSLDDVMRLAFARYGGERGFTREEFVALAEEVAGRDLKKWFEWVADSTAELDYSDALDWFGLRFKDAPAAKPSLGFATRIEDGRVLIKEVRRGTGAYEAGVAAGDEVIAIDDHRVLPARWPAVVEQFRPGERVELLMSRGERLVTLQLSVEEEARRKWLIEMDPKATDRQRQNLKDWLKGGYTWAEGADDGG